MYTLRAIFLSKQLIRDNQIRIILFTEEFGKITAWSKKNQNCLDIGSLGEVVIERKGQENMIHGITPILTPKNEGWNYDATLNYLTLFQILRESLPEGMELRGIFGDIREVLEYLSEIRRYTESIKLVQLFILMKARIIKKQGHLREQIFTSSHELNIIYKRLDQASMKSMISSKTIESTTLMTIQHAVHEGMYSFKNRL